MACCKDFLDYTDVVDEETKIFENLSIFSLDKVVDSVRKNYCDSKIAVLKAIVAYFHKSINPDVDYAVPNYVQKLPMLIRNYIYRELENAGIQNIQYFYDYCVTSLAQNLANHCPVVGFKIMIQMIAFRYPSVTECSFAKMAVLRNTYEDDEHICLKLLWAFSQAGYKDINVGIRVWLNLMSPVISVPAYASFCARYINRIIDSNSLNCLSLSERDFQHTIEALMAEYKIGGDLLMLLTETASMLANKYVELSENVSLVFLILLKNLNRKNSLADPLIECIYLDPSKCFTLWNIVLKDNLLQTHHILTYIEENWATLGLCLGRTANFIEFLNKIRCHPAIAKAADSVILKIICENFEEEPQCQCVCLDSSSPCKRYCITMAKNKNKLEKGSGQEKQQPAPQPQQSKPQKKGEKQFKKVMEPKKFTKKAKTETSSCKATSSCCKWTFGILLLIAAIVGAINYDVHIHGGEFQKSATGKFLKDIGALPHVEVAWYTSMKHCARGYQWVEANAPVFVGKTCVVLKPYWEFTKDLAVIAAGGVKTGLTRVGEIVNEKSPVVLEFIEGYAPGLPQKIKQNSVKLWVYVSNTSYDLFINTRQFVNDKVLVGKFSPENLNRVFNQTQVMAVEYYSWFQKKVDHYAKI